MGTVVITGASSGLGKEFALRLSEGNRIILSGRDMIRLTEVSEQIPQSEIFCADLSDEEVCKRLFYTYPDAEMIINCAGFGVFGQFCATKLDDELKMLDVNIRAVHILTKLYAGEFVKRGRGTILNVSSTAAFFTGPLFSSYYASKAYVYRLTTALHKELKGRYPDIKVSALCPGPVDTEFNERAGVCAGKGAATPSFVAETALKNLGKRVIIPGLFSKLTVFFSKIIPESLLSAVNYRLQKEKQAKYRKRNN